MLLFMDGCDHSGTNWVTTFGKWTEGYYAEYQTGRAGPHTGTGFFAGPGTAYCRVKVFPSSNELIVGFASYFPVFPTSAVFLWVGEGSSQGSSHLALRLASSVLKVERGDGTVLGTGTTVLSTGNWYYFEVKVVVHDTLGSFEVRIDGVPEPGLSQTNVDTRSGGVGSPNRVTFNMPVNYQQFDDIYICDTSGPAPLNGFLGRVRIETLYPQTDAVAAGTLSGLTPSTGTDHGALVDEVVPNTTDYNASAVPGAADSYHYPPRTLPGAIFAVQVNPLLAKSDDSSQHMSAFLRVGGQNFEAVPAMGVAPTFLYRSVLYPVNPLTGEAWTTADIATLEAGVKIVGAL